MERDSGNLPQYKLAHVVTAASSRRAQGVLFLFSPAPPWVCNCIHPRVPSSISFHLTGSPHNGYIHGYIVRATARKAALRQGLGNHPLNPRGVASIINGLELTTLSRFYFGYLFRKYVLFNCSSSTRSPFAYVWMISLTDRPINTFTVNPPCLRIFQCHCSWHHRKTKVINNFIDFRPLFTRTS